MSQIPSGTSTSGSSSTSSSSGASSGNDLRNVDMSGFLKLLIAQMQNQDPLKPMENTEIMQQIGEIRSISATDKLTDTLDSVLMGQNLTTASSMIGKRITALTDDAKDISGIVDRVSVEADADGSNRKLRVVIGDQKVDLKNIRSVVPA
jgi:flagellar basal-body rod modification protein FlgD